MRNSRILKLFSYIMLPIFVGILIISIFYIQVKDATYYDEEKYFESEQLLDDNHLVFRYNVKLI